MQPALDGLAEYQSGRTAEQRREATQHLHSVEVQAKKQNTDDAKWTANFNKLAAFQAEHGDLRLPVGHKLYTWTDNQRTRKHNLSDERIASLDGLGFEWDIQDAKWTAKFDKLAAFQAVNGNLNVPKGHEVYNWTINQRRVKKNRKLSNERIASLDGLGFAWFG